MPGNKFSLFYIGNYTRLFDFSLFECSVVLFFCLTTLSFLPSIDAFSQGTLIGNFGNNPGNLEAWEYVPANTSANVPLVIVLHGCAQNAQSFSTETGWNSLAEEHQFFVLHIGQKLINNTSYCFNYWNPGDHSRDQGEALSVKQAVDYMKANHSIDSSKVFITGLSAGGAFTMVMLAAYPELFAAGAEMAGLPYKAAANLSETSLAMGGYISKTPQQWGNLARAENPSFTGPYPRLAIIHGTADFTVNKNNAEEAVKQFTNLHQTDQIADFTDSLFNENSSVVKTQYCDANGRVGVEYYAVTGMGHGIAVDPGNCFQQGGSAATYAIAVDNFYSSFWAAHFFGILQFPFSINGLTRVNINQQNISYTVADSVPGSVYAWSVPSDATIISGQGTGNITVDWGENSGYVSVIETNNNCKTGPVEVYITAEIPGRTKNIQENKEIIIYPNPNKGTFTLLLPPGYRKPSILSTIYNSFGEIIFSDEISPGVSTVPFSFANIPEGLYVLRITPIGSDSEYLVKRFLVCNN